MREELTKKFEENLQMAREDYPTATFNEHIRLATEWTIGDLTNSIGQIAETRLAAHQEGICQHTDPSRNTLLGIGQ